MSFVSGTTGNEAAQKFLDVLQSDFKNLGLETKKKYPQIKEVSKSRKYSTSIQLLGSTYNSCEKIDFHYLFCSRMQ